MINASTTLKNMIANGCSFFNYVDVYLRDGTLIQLEPKDIMINGFTMEDSTTSSNAFEIGATVGKTASLRIANHNEQYSSYDFFKAFFYVYVCAEVNGQIERIRKGKYYVITPETEGDVISLSGVDSMYLFDKPYNFETEYPATLKEIISDCCLYCGVEIGFTSFLHDDFLVTVKPEEGCTYRQVLSWACQLAGYNARISNEDKLELVFWETEEADEYIYKGGSFGQNNPNLIDGGNFENYETDTIIFGGDFIEYAYSKETKYGNLKSLNVSTDSVLITGVKIKINSIERLIGTDEYPIVIEKNPFVLTNIDTVLEMLRVRLVGRTFRPFEAQILNNPLVEPFDVCSVVDRKGNQYFTYINKVSYKIGGYTTISCKATSPTRIESTYVSESAKAVIEERRNTEERLNRYDLSVQNMNMLAMNSLGFHTTYETLDDGSKITYLHDKPLLSDSKIIYKQTVDGFFLSQDGGESYTAGFDSEGNAVLNVLSAIGIQFDWARGGTLTLGDEEDVRGYLVVKNEKNETVCTLDNRGITANAGRIGCLSIGYNSLEYRTLSSHMTISSAGIEMGSASNLFKVDMGGNLEAYTGKIGLVDIKTGEISYSQSIGNYKLSTSGLTIGSTVGTSTLTSLKLSTGTIEATGKISTGSGNIETNTGDIKTTTGNIEANSTASEIKAPNGKLSGKTVIGTTELMSGGSSSATAYFYSSVTSAKLTASSVTICNSSNNLGFFGTSPTRRKTVSKITSTSTATASSCAEKINALLTALQDYGLIKNY